MLDLACGVGSYCGKHHCRKKGGTCAACESDEPAAQWVTEFRDSVTGKVVSSQTAEEEREHLCEHLCAQGASDAYLTSGEETWWRIGGNRPII